jgi:hypothetical protein
VRIRTRFTECTACTEIDRVFENRVLRRIFAPRRNEVTEGWRKLYNEELYNSHPSPNIIRMITSKRMTWKMYVGSMEKKGMHTEFWFENQKER